MNKGVILALIVFLVGCSTSSEVTVGSLTWHKKRVAEIDQAFEVGEITKAEQIELKNEADKIRQDYVYGMDTKFRFGFGYHHSNLHDHHHD